MHILLTNDDGPPSAHASPYIASFARILSSPPFNHKVSVVIPSQQRSWIGKAHILPPSSYAVSGGSDGQKSKNEDVTDVITPRFYLPATGEVRDTIPSLRDAGQERDDYWVLVPGTPAACAQLGIFHYAELFPGSSPAIQTQQPQDPSSLTSPIDLVISGPNLGRNTSAAFALSSGTLGGALEAAISGVHAIALSFAFFTKKEPQHIVDEACVHAVRICEKLVEGWTQDDGKGKWYVGPETGEGEGKDVPDLYTVNVPLVEGISDLPVKWTWILNQRWTGGSLYQAVSSQGVAAESSPSETAKIESNEAKVTQDESAASPPAASSRNEAPTFKWSPSFKDMWKTVAESPAGNDGLVVTQRASSVTPLKANFQGLFGRGGFVGDLKL